MTTISKTAAEKIARHLIGAVHVIAAGNGGKTYGYTYACGPKHVRNWHGCSSYHVAASQRADHVKMLAREIMNGDAPEWASLDFKW